MPRRIGYQGFQLFVLVAFDKTVSRYYVRSATKRNAQRLALSGGEASDHIFEVVELPMCISVCLTGAF